MGKGRNSSLRAVFPLPAVFFLDLYCRYMKKKGLIWERDKDRPKFVVCQWSTFKAPFTKIVVIVADVDQDQAAQNVQPDLRLTLSVMLEHLRQKISRNLPPPLCYCRIKLFVGFICHFNPLPDNKIVDWSKLKQIADDILKSI